MYGRAETVTGTLSQKVQINDKLFLATKVWKQGKEAGIGQMNASLERLKRTTLDLMQVHNLVDWQTQLATLRDWKQKGTFRYIGITHYGSGRFEEMERILRDQKVDFIQLPYSIGVRDAEKRLLPAAADTGTAVLVMRPLEGGNLFGRVKDQPLPDFAREFAQSWAQVFLKFILAHPAVTCVIPATSKPKHMQDNIAAGYGHLPDEPERRKLVELLGG
jgi:diketogulonate reductase-like aldo/keto reductase